MSFKDWFNKELANDKRSAVYIAGAKRGFEAGQQSKQAEIDALKAEIAKYQQEGYKLVPVDEIAEVKKSRFSFGEDEACKLGNSMIENYSRNSKP